MTRALLPFLILGGTLSACADPVSNEIFASDRAFLEALPSKDRHEVDLTTDPGGDNQGLPAYDNLPLDAPDLLIWSVATAQSFNLMVDDLLLIVDTVRMLAPTERTNDRRTWGPFPHPSHPEFSISMTMTREGRGAYDWSFGIGETGSDVHTTFFYGSHFAGDSVAEGDGAFVWDYDALASVVDTVWTGALIVDYDHRVAKELLVDLDAVRSSAEDDTVDGQYWYWFDGTAGDFEFRTAIDVFEGEEPLDELLEVRSRWTAGEPGRGDGVWSGGNLETELGLEVTATQCWDAVGSATYEFDTLTGAGTGDVSACPFDDFATVTHIPAN